MKFALTLLFTTVSLSVTAMAADGKLDLVDPALFGLGAPGFGTQVTGSGTMDFKDGKGGLDLVDGRARLPLWAYDFGEGTLFGASVTYSWAAMSLENGLGLGDVRLHDTSLQIGLAHFPKSDSGWMGLLIASPGLGTDYTGLNADDFNFSAVAVGGYQFSPHFTLAAAAVYMQAIGEARFIPAVGFIWQPNETWLVQATAPVLAVGYKANDQLSFNLSAYPTGGSWSVDNLGRDEQITAIKLESWRAGLGVEYRLDKHWRFNAQAGLNFGGNLELRDSGERVLLGTDLDTSPFALLGVTWAF